MQEQNELICTAGFARLDITPPLGVGIGGYFTQRESKGVLDPLYVNAVAFGQGEKSAVLLVCDLLGLYGHLGRQQPGELARDLGLEESSVFLCCTHTHTSPNVGADREGSDPMYDAWFCRRLRDAARMAMEDRKPVTDVQWARGEAHDVAFVRRFFMKDGTALTNPKNADPEIDRPVNETDESIRLTRILRQGGKEIVLVNFQNHPDSVGGELISADWPGAMCRTVETGRDVHCVFLNGAEGQMTPNNKTKPKIPASHARAMEIGEKTGVAALDLFDKTISTGMAGLSTRKGTVALKTKRDPFRVPEAQRIIRARQEGRDEEIHPVLKFANYLFAEAEVLCRLEQEQQDHMEAPVTALVFCGLALVGFPGEPFNEVGKYIRMHSQFPDTCVCCQTNGAMGYFPMERDYEVGGYETCRSPLVKGTTEQMMHFAEQLLASV